MLPKPTKALCCQHRCTDMLKLRRRSVCIGCFALDSRTLQIASCSVHHSGALLLEVRDGEFLDAHLCSTSVASSNHLQQPEPEFEAAFQAGVRPQQGNDFVQNGSEAFGNDYDDGGGGGDDGDDYVHQEAADQHNNAMPGGQSWLDNAVLQKCFAG